jgi:hypothetical protein
VRAAARRWPSPPDFDHRSIKLSRFRVKPSTANSSRSSLIGQTFVGMDAKQTALIWDALLHGGAPNRLGLPQVGGRVDLRGLVAPIPAVAGEFASPHARVTTLRGLVEIRGVRWSGVDFSGSDLKSLRLFDSAIDDCLSRRRNAVTGACGARPSQTAVFAVRTFETRLSEGLTKAGETPFVGWISRARTSEGRRTGLLT